ncbi:hypothetical protein ACFWDI_12630 [Streptomyces sp. NPDC060064]|uniref:hypothetical protein n=1 Tax=Streptomyces sp. NPDC060064 TaxID=3347049 RepID=UPI00368CB536
MERTAALRLDAEWAKVRSGRAGASPRERERMLTDLIAALAAHAADDLSLTARLSLRYGDLARHHFDTGRREDALTAVDEAIRRCEEPARHDEEHARWYARALISQAVYLAEPLSDELGLPRYALHPMGEQPRPVTARTDSPPWRQPAEPLRSGSASNARTRATRRASLRRMPSSATGWRSWACRWRLRPGPYGPSVSSTPCGPRPTRARRRMRWPLSTSTTSWNADCGAALSTAA